MSDWLILVGGVIVAGLGGDLFERGLVDLAGWLRVPSRIVGVTFAAFATSSPELSVAISSASAGTPELALGGALGSNIMNFGLVLGLVAAIWSVGAARADVRRDLPVVLIAPPLTYLLAFDGTLSRADGLILISLFLAWLGSTIHNARKTRAERVEGAPKANVSKIAVLIAVGFVSLVAAGQMIVMASEGLGRSYGLDPFLVGATLVAFGTSVPELSTALISRLRGRGEVGFGTLLGSNLFNGLFIIGVAATIRPMQIVGASVWVGLLFGVVTVVVAWPTRRDLVTRPQGLALLAAYAAYVLVVLMDRPHPGA